MLSISSFYEPSLRNDLSFCREGKGEEWQERINYRNDASCDCPVISSVFNISSHGRRKENSCMKGTGAVRLWGGVRGGHQSSLSTKLSLIFILNILLSRPLRPGLGVTDRITAVSRERIINLIMTVCCHRNHSSPRLVLIQRILLATKTTKLCLSDCADKQR